MIFTLIILISIAAPVWIYRRGGNLFRIGAVTWLVGIGVALFATTGPYGAYTLFVYAIAVFVIGGMTVLLAMAWEMIHFR